VNEFIQRYGDRVIGVLSGFDRLLFQGTLRSISYVEALNRFLSVHHILYKDFATFVQRCTAQIERHAKAVAHRAGRPYQYIAKPSLSKEDLALQLARKQDVKKGLVCVFSAVEPCQTFDIYRDRESKRLRLVSRTRKCRFFYFYFIDREFGLMHVRLQSWLPFSIQVCLNGRSFLARQMEREGIDYVQRDNTFTTVADLKRAQLLLDRLTRRNWAKTLNRWAGRANPLPPILGLVGQFGYYWSIRQSEVATDVMFRDRQSLQAVYPALCRHAMEHFHSHDVMRFLSGRTGGKLASEVVTGKHERIEGVRIKHVVNANSLKMYDKQGSVLRIETTINNPRPFRVLRGDPSEGTAALTWRPMRKGVSDTSRRVAVSLAANERYLQALAVVGEETPSHRILDPVSVPVYKQGQRYRALRPVSPQEARLFAALLAGEHLLAGFTNRQIQAQIFSSPASDERERRRRSASVSRQFRLLRAHGLIHKLSRHRRYRATPWGHAVMTTALIFRQTDATLLKREAA
jgi:hypothetical protein